MAFTGKLLCLCKAPEETTVPLSVTARIKYFGFTLVDTYWYDPTDAERKANYIDEVVPFSRIVDILAADPMDNMTC